MKRGISIKNDDRQKSLAVDWPKADIHYNIGSTLLPNQLACNYNSLAERSDNPGDFKKYVDKDAPITYSSTTKCKKLGSTGSPRMRARTPQALEPIRILGQTTEETRIRRRLAPREARKQTDG
jgi:hypothetical protein